MALIACPECGQMISDKAKTCPHCGTPLVGKVIIRCQNGIGKMNRIAVYVNGERIDALISGQQITLTITEPTKIYARGEGFNSKFRKQSDEITVDVGEDVKLGLMLNMIKIGIVKVDDFDKYKEFR